MGSIVGKGRGNLGSRPLAVSTNVSGNKLAMRMQAKLGAVAALVLVAAMLAAPAQAQVRNSGASPIALNAVLSDSVTLTLSGNAVNFMLLGVSASNPGST